MRRKEFEMIDRMKENGRNVGSKRLAEVKEK